ncbi:MAG: hypothetical protein BIFFINMI_03811 [Phycisphaerae bacterium]|nr:hypothetical protein [Phycisphaerae bacterium]
MTSAPTAPRTIPTRQRPAPASQPSQTNGKPAFMPIGSAGGHRVVIYGPGGIGKTTLAAIAPGPVAFFDLDDSLAVLRSQLPEELARQINRVGGAGDWQAIRDTLHMSGWDEIKTIVIDSATKAEELALAWTLKHVPHEKGAKIERIEDYGYGKGYQHLYDTFLALLGDLDQHVRAGRNVVLICHDCTATVPNPNGEDWIRYEPRLQSPNSGKSSIRLRVREWADHVLFVGYDVDVKEGKGKGSGTRTVYPNELPHCMAKSRTLADTIPLVKFDPGLWARLLA